MSHNLSETGGKESLGDCRAYRHHVSLTKRTGGILDAALNIHFRMTRSDTTPLTEVLKILYGKFAGERKYAVEHRRHMTGIKEETVACEPLGVCGIIHKET